MQAPSSNTAASDSMQSSKVAFLGEELSTALTTTLQSIEHSLRAHSLYEELLSVEEELSRVEDKKSKRELLFSKAKVKKELIHLGILEETAEVSMDVLATVVKEKVFSAYTCVAPLVGRLETASEAFASQGEDDGLEKAEQTDNFIEELENVSKPLAILIEVSVLKYSS